MTTYIVSQADGVDVAGRSGLPGSPWKTISYAIGRSSVKNGDTIQVKNGSYYEVVKVNKELTIEAYSGHSPQVTGRVDENGPNSGLPAGNPSKISRTCGIIEAVYKGLVHIVADNVTWDGIDIINGRGEGLQLGDGNNDYSTITIQNCYITNHRFRCIQISGNGQTGVFVDTVVIDNVEASFGGMLTPCSDKDVNWPGMVSAKGADGLVIKNCDFYYSWGSGVIIDGNGKLSRDVKIEDCTIGDTWGTALYYHACQKAVAQRNLIYSTRTGRGYLQQSKDGYSAAGINVASKESTKQYGESKYVKVCNNIIVKRGKAIAVSKQQAPVYDTKIMNNTILNCNIGFQLNVGDVVTPAIIKNNLITNVNTKADGSLSKWTWDYNCWDAAPAAAAQGANDVTDATPIKLRTWDPPDHVVNMSASQRATFLAKLKAEADNATLNASSGASDAGDDLTTSYAAGSGIAADTKDYFGTSFAGSWPIGAHEDAGGVTGPTATAGTVGATTGNIDFSVSFTGAAAGGTAPYTYAWDFGDGSTSTSQNPTHIYTVAGVYTATLTVTDDSTEGLRDTDTVTITAQPESTPASGPVVIEAVDFSAGAATYAVSGSTAPIAIIIVGSIPTAFDTLSADSALSVGFWTATKQVAVCITGEDGQTTSDVGEVTRDDYTVYMTNPGVPAGSLFTGEITSATSTTVSLTWTGTTSSEKFTAYNFYGSGVTNASVITESITSNATILGDYNFLVSATTGRAVDEPRDRVDLSLGFAERSGPTQMCAGIGQKSAQSTTDVAGVVRNDAIATRPIYGDRITIDTWDSSSINLSASSSAAAKTFVALAMSLSSDAEVYIEDITLPTATGNNDYTTANFQAQAGFMLLTNQDTINTIQDGSNGGVFGWGSVDNATPDIDHSYCITSKDAVTQSVENSYASDSIVMIDEDGSTTLDADATLEATGLRLSVTTALTGTHLGVLCLIKETTSAGGGPTAAFSFSPEEPTTADTINFYDASSDDGVNSIDTWDWDWGDGTANGNTQNPTHSYSSPGNYTVTLTVTDDNSDEDSTTRGVSVSSTGDAVIVIDASPLSGSAPLDVTFDASDSTEASGETFVDSLTRWDIYRYYGDDIDDISADLYLSVFGITPTVTITEAGQYRAFCHLYYQSDQSSPAFIFWSDDVFVYADTELTLSAQDGKVVTTGPYTADFVLNSNRAETTTAYIDWDFGDGTTTADYGEDTTSHTYHAHEDEYYLDFNGTTTLINCGSDAALDDLQDAAMTVEAWIKADSSGEASGVIAAKATSALLEGWCFRVSASALNVFIRCATTDTVATAETTEFTPDGEWYHVAFTWDDASFTYPKLWINGTESTYNTTTNRSGAIVSDAAHSLTIGNDTSVGRTFDGGIAWVRVSDSVLYTATFTPPEKYAPPATATTTVEQWNLNDGSGATAAAEEDTPTNDGTITDGTWTNFTEDFVYDVSATVTYEEGDSTATQSDYITIVPSPDTPLNLAALEAIAAEIKKHVGCLADATWVQDGTYTNVYTATVARKWASGYTYTVKEDGQDLTSQASIANCDGVAGSYYVNYSDPNLEVSVHATGSDDPTSNGSTYSLRFT